MPKKQQTKAKPKKRPPIVLNDQQLADFWRETARRRSASSVALAICASTGARPQESLNLKWGEYDDGTELMLRTLKDDDNGLRYAKLCLPAKDILDRWRAKAAAHGMLEPTRLIFSTNGNGKTITDRAVRYAAKSIGAAIGVPDLQPYDLRRTFATRVANKMTLKALQVLLGHKNATSTMRYVQASQDDRDRAASLMDSTGSSDSSRE